jgi:hypothetical protein
MFFSSKYVFHEKGEDRVVLIFPPKGTSVERGCYQVVCRKGYQGRVYLVVCGFKRVIRPKTLEDMLEDFSLTNFLNLLFGYFVTVFSGNNEQSSDRFFFSIVSQVFFEKDVSDAARCGELFSLDI